MLMALSRWGSGFGLFSKKKSIPHDGFYIDAMEKLGYTEELLKKRALIYDNAQECLTKVQNRNWPESIKIVVAGSRGEGMAISLNSDIDLIYIQPAVKCFESYATADSEVVNNCVAAFQLDFSDVPSGYTKLQLKGEFNQDMVEDYKHLIDNFRKCLTSTDYLKSGMRIVEAVEYHGEDLHTEGWISENYEFDELTGPSQPMKCPIPFCPDMYVSFDYVQAFPCVYPSVLEAFLKREGRCTWPGDDVLKAVKDADIYVVSVGMKGSKESSLQWRISFTSAEKCLVRSFNDTQIKVYAAMKMLAKHSLKPICANITSYMVKNVVFWIFETSPGPFERDCFNEMLLQALSYLQKCLQTGIIKNYMVPSRNLLQGKIAERERMDLLKQLDVLVDEGLSALLRCPLIKSMTDISEGALERALTFRNLTDQIALAYLSLNPETFDIVEHSLHIAKNPYQLVKVFMDNVFPVIRESNPFEYFFLLNGMGRFELIRSVAAGLVLVDKVWLD